MSDPTLNAPEPAAPATSATPAQPAVAPVAPVAPVVPTVHVRVGGSGSETPFGIVRFVEVVPDAEHVRAGVAAAHVASAVNLHDEYHARILRNRQAVAL